MFVLAIVVFSSAAQAELSREPGATRGDGHFSRPVAPNMNGDYILSPTPNAGATQKNFPTHFADYPRGVDYFDVYSPPITSLYSQVFWKGLDPVELPRDVVQRFDGKGMSVVGFEMDQVRKTADGDISVPISVAYNHHFESQMVGKHAAFEKVYINGPDDPRMQEHDMGHGIPSHAELWIVRDRGTSAGKIPISQDFGGANGGEFRKSFHGFAPGYVQVIDSPTHFQITPMQIDTWNRDKMNVSHPTTFVPGPVPRNSLAPIEGRDALYSGLLECPVTSRIRKDIDDDYVAQSSGKCGFSIGTASECFAGAEKLLSAGGVNFTYGLTNETHRPDGCSVAADAEDPRRVHVFFNKPPDGKGAACGAGSALVAGSSQSLVRLDVQLDLAEERAAINVTGPADVWFGVGFKASAMKDEPWAIIVDGAGDVTERKLADQNPGKVLSRSVNVVAVTVSGALRTVSMTRPFKGPSADHFTFDPAVVALRFINAVGTGPALAYHEDKAPSAIHLLPVATGSNVAGACVCASEPAPFGQGTGALTYVRTSQAEDVGSGTIRFGNICPAQPRSDLLAMENPTCDIRTYIGGQTACHHMFSLLDADQEIPWPDQPLQYRLKFRFWVQEYSESYHTNVLRTTWGIASPVEYDVPKCDHDVMGCTQHSDGSWVHTITGTFTGAGKLVAAHFHCHAPTCLSIAMYKCPKGTAVCNGTTGDLLCREDPVYGGTGRIDLPNFDEPGFILQPPCLWGSPEFGLEPPPDVTGAVLGTVKTSNATYGHHGEMAWQQIFYVSTDSRTPPAVPGGSAPIAAASRRPVANRPHFNWV